MAAPDFADFIAYHKKKRGKIAKLLNARNDPLAPYMTELETIYNQIAADYTSPISSALASLPMQMRKFMRDRHSEELMRKTVEDDIHFYNPQVLQKMIDAGFFKQPRKAAYDLRTESNLLPGTQAGYDLWKEHPHLFDFPDIDSGNLGGTYQALVHSYRTWRSSTPVVLPQLKMDYPRIRFPKNLSLTKSAMEISKVLKKPNTDSMKNFIEWLGNDDIKEHALTATALAKLVYDLDTNTYTPYGVTRSRFEKRNRGLPEADQISEDTIKQLLKQIKYAGDTEHQAKRGLQTNFT